MSSKTHRHGKSYSTVTRCRSGIPCFLALLFAFGMSTVYAQDSTAAQQRQVAARKNETMQKEAQASGQKGSPRRVTILDVSSNIDESSLICDTTEVRGTLRDSSLGLPEYLTVGSLIAATNLRCGPGSSTDHMLRVVKDITSAPGSASFVLSTIDVAAPIGSCLEDAKVTVGQERLCIQQQQLPSVKFISSSSKIDGYTHSIYINVAADLLNKLDIPGFDSEDVYIALAVSNSADDLPEAQCGLASYSGSVQRLVGKQGSVLLAAPFSLCARTCSDDILLQGSPCLRLSFRENVPEDEEAMANAKLNEEDHPFRFVEDGSDPMLDGVASKAAAQMRSYRLSRSMVGLIVGVCVAAVIILIGAFVAVRCTNGRHRRWLGQYFSTFNRTTPDAEDGMAAHIVTQPTFSGGYSAAATLDRPLASSISPSYGPGVYDVPPLPVTTKTLPPLRSIHSSSSPLAPPLQSHFSYTYYPDDTLQKPPSHKVAGRYYNAFIPGRYAHVTPSNADSV